MQETGRRTQGLSGTGVWSGAVRLPKLTKPRRDRAPGPLLNSVQENDSSPRHAGAVGAASYEPGAETLVFVGRQGGESILALTFL